MSPSYVAPVTSTATTPTPREISDERSPADRLYRGVTQGTGMVALVVMALIAIFLSTRATTALRTAGWSFFTEDRWRPDQPGGGPFGIRSVLLDTMLVSGIAITIAVPSAIATALFINEYSPRRVRKFLTSMVDLLAAVPAIVYGLWGRNVLQGHLIGVSKWLNHNVGFIPLFKVDDQQFIGSRFAAGVVVSIMVLPIATSVMREVFSQAPAGEREAALALGSTRWDMVRTVVLPYGRGGIIGGSMLALGRALGETVAVALILVTRFGVNLRVLGSGGATIASLIGSQAAEAQRTGLSALMAAGLVLFAVTLVVNFVAAMIVARTRSGAGLEL